MTIIVGIKCTDGVVIASDSAATSVAQHPAGELPTIEQQTKKIEILENRIIVAGSGEIGVGQRFRSIVKKAWAAKIFTKGEDPIKICNGLAGEGINDFLSTGLGKKESGQFGRFSYGCLVGFPLGSKLHLCEFPGTNFQPELKDDNIWYVSMGSGQGMGDPFLGFIRSVFWENGPPSLEGGRFAATWTIQHAIDLNAGGINGPIQMAELSINEKGDAEANYIPEREIAEHNGMIEEAKKALRGFKEAMKGEDKDLPSFGDKENPSPKS